MTSSDSNRQIPKSWLVLFLGTPIIWYLYFWVVYLAAEVACALGMFDFVLLGFSGISVLTVLTTAIAGVAIAALTVAAYRHWSTPTGGSGDGRDDYQHTLMQVGFLLGIMFLVTIVIIGLPALVLSPC